MSKAKLLDGKKLAGKLELELKRQVMALGARGIKPTLAVILIGDDPASKIYVRAKNQACLRTGIDFLLYKFAADERQEVVEEVIQYLNHDREVTGILLQLPVPENFNREELIALIAREKDVDGLKKNSLYPMPTPRGILTLLRSAKIELKGKKVTILGRGFLVGEPLGKLLRRWGAKVAWCEADDPHAEVLAKTLEADILVSATGKKGIVTKKMVKKGAVVIDCGSFRNPKTGKIEGEVRTEVASKAGAITPVPGGVGPMTVVSLLENVVKAARKYKTRVPED